MATSDIIGVQYTEGDVDTTITGSAFMWEDTGNTLRSVSATKPLPVDIIGATGVTLDVAIDKDNDSVEAWFNTVKDGSGIAYVPLVDSDGHQQIDVLSSALPTGASTLAEQQSQTTHLASIAGEDFATQTTLAALLTESDFGTRVGEVQASPTANTVLARLKDIDDALGGTLTVDTELPAAALMADGTATPTAPAVAGHMMGYIDGTTDWDFVRLVPTGPADMVDAHPVTLASDQPAIEIEGDAAEDTAASGNPVLTGGRYDSTPRSLDNLDAGAFAIDAAGRMQIASGETENGPVQTQPILIGGRYDTTERSLNSGDVGAVALDSQGVIRTKDLLLEIMKGNVVGHTVMSAMGEWESGNVDAAGEDCCRWEDVSGPARLPTPDAAGEQMTLVSDDAADDSGDTGVNTVRIHYLDDTGAEQTETVTMNGTTDVDTTATDIRFVNDMYALTVGSNGVAEGNITIRKKGTAVGVGLYNMIGAGGNKSLVPHRMVPLGKTLYLQKWHTEISSNDRCAMKIRSTDMYGALISGIFCFKGVAYVSKAASGEMDIHSTPIPALSIVKVSHWDDQAGSEGSCGWWGILVDN